MCHPVPGVTVWSKVLQEWVSNISPKVNKHFKIIKTKYVSNTLLEVRKLVFKIKLGNSIWISLVLVLQNENLKIITY